MARLPRMVLPGIPHHVTQRGHRRERTFFEDGDCALYLDLLSEGAFGYGVEVLESFVTMKISIRMSKQAGGRGGGGGSRSQ